MRQFTLAIVCLFAVLLVFTFSASAQTNASPGRTQNSTVTVPFVGCKADGQVGPVDAPKGYPKQVAIPPQIARRLAYYKSEYDAGVLAPRGWYCFATYGSNGGSLYISPEPLKGVDFFSPTWKGFSGPVIQLSYSIGDTSGRFRVAEIIARVFPSHMKFVRRVIAEGEPAKSFPTGPYPNDQLTYRGKEVVEFETPANTEGLGTRSRLQKNGSSIRGVAILVGDEPDLLELSLRLPQGMRDIEPIIIRQAEIEAAKAR